jgi:predicted nucleic acid-binding Zn ribbon protein
MCLEDSGTLRPWRGARDERDWPTKLVAHGDTWPWEVANELKTVAFCIKCQKLIPEEYNSEKYCSNECGSAYRMAQSRLKKKPTPEPSQPELA